MQRIKRSDPMRPGAHQPGSAAAAVLLAALLAMIALVPSSVRAIGQFDPPPAREATVSAPNFLVDAGGRAVYVFSADGRGTEARAPESTCGGACAREWPPVTTEEEPGAEGQAKGAMISTLRRADGRLQVIYNGWPLYYFRHDRTKARATGADREAFGGTWRLITPDGRLVQGRTPVF
jgi:predicted lipoprotein with Yx(FWY)xxD motif